MTPDLDLLTELLEFLEGQYDVRDGSYGEPSPNAAMSLGTRLEHEIERLQRATRRPDPLGQALNEGDGSYKP